MCFDDSAMHCLIHLPYFIVYMHICGSIYMHICESVRPEVNLRFCSSKTIHFVSGDSLSQGSGFTN